MQIRDILILQKRELDSKLKEIYVERDLEIKNIKSDLIKVIIGPRRSGKSFFAVHILNKIGNFGYVNFDDERLVDVKDYDEIVDATNSIYDNPKFLLLDEIQNLEKWELFVNRLQRQGYYLFITGSNANLLSMELATHLTGRHIPITLFPFSFKEFLTLEKNKSTESEIREKMYYYLTYGGYPEPLIKKLDYIEYLSSLFNSIIYKDIVKRFRIRSISAIEDLATYLVSNLAKEFSYNTLSKVTKCKSVHTVQKYLKYLEEAFIFFQLSRFSYKVKEQMASNKKIYCIDNGFIQAKAFKSGSDIGRICENVVAIELKKLELKHLAKIYYWKTPRDEVDFLLKRENVDQLIQVCYDISDVKTKERETRSLINASKVLNCQNLLVITENYAAEELVSWFGIERNIKFIPLYKWLLSDTFSL
jgi:hypothetical protein